MYKTHRVILKRAKELRLVHPRIKVWEYQGRWFAYLTHKVNGTEQHYASVSLEPGWGKHITISVLANKVMGYV